ncbi:MAG: iron-sulfur cluster assembly scaffold protein [Thermodesulfobacteriota bacterium]|nr:iron-sulfur cluster assembly scaffold protein [Thermodesulfobacteriota bacterium]
MTDLSTTGKNFDFWQNHSFNYLQMAFRTDKREVVHHPDGYGKRTGQCGDTVEIFLAVRHDKIDSVSFQTDGCINTNACANTVACLAEGKHIDQAWEISPETVIDYLGTLPAEKTHCAEVAVGAFYLALANLRELKRSPWKKHYPHQMIKSR